MPLSMAEINVHNYALRKALGYVRIKKGKIKSESIRTKFENSVHQKLSLEPPYLPLYYPIKSFIILLQIIKNNLGDAETSTDKITERSYDVGFYLYTGPEEKNSPYKYLDPHKHLSEVITDFYNHLHTANAIFRGCENTLTEEESKIRGSWEGCEEHDELFHYIEGIHAGIIRASTSEGVLSAKREGSAFVFEIDLKD